MSTVNQNTAATRGQGLIKEDTPSPDAPNGGGTADLFGGMPEVRSPAPAQKNYGEQSQAQAEGEQPDQQAEPAASRHFLPGEQQQDLSNKRQAIESRSETSKEGQQLRYGATQR
jgi:hypothetical protein